MKQFCPKGHDTFIVGRSKTFNCKQCQRDRKAKWRKAHRKTAAARQRKYYKTFTGMLTLSYVALKARCLGSGSEYVQSIYKGRGFCTKAEFVQSAIDQGVKEMWQTWVDSGYSRKLRPVPDVDECDYTPENIDWVTASENARRSGSKNGGRVR